MRLRRNRLRIAYLRKAIQVKDEEGNSCVEYAPPESFVAEEWAAGGKAQAEMYGTRLPGIRNLRIEGCYQERRNACGGIEYAIDDGPVFSVNDGICLCSGEHGEPDYRIVAVYPYRFLTLEIERI